MTILEIEYYVNATIKMLESILRLQFTYYKKDILLYGKTVSEGVLKKQLEDIERIYDR